MFRSATFWVVVITFQIIYGFSVFTLTRAHYKQDVERDDAQAVSVNQATGQWPEPTSDNGLEQLISMVPGQAASMDPVVLAAQADEHYVNRRYAQAADIYEQLVNSGSGSVDLYNNLGITLHYLGRSEEAIQRLNEGVELDPTYQRIWLTLGFVTSQLGQSTQALTALNEAIRLGPNTEVGQSATEMRESLISE
jgi:Flp pilus assembly protein TadD